MENNNETSCQQCDKKSQACISFFAHENAMLHKDEDNARAHRTNIVICVTFLLIILIFVTAYTIRTNIWLDTVKGMYAALVELANAKGIAAP